MKNDEEEYAPWCLTIELVRRNRSAIRRALKWDLIALALFLWMVGGTALFEATWGWPCPFCCWNTTQTEQRLLCSIDRLRDYLANELSRIVPPLYSFMDKDSWEHSFYAVLLTHPFRLLAQVGKIRLVGAMLPLGLVALPVAPRAAARTLLEFPLAVFELLVDLVQAVAQMLTIAGNRYGQPSWYEQTIRPIFD
jgi:hypothetical protein